jgi:thiol-disulfide isomerase/thioredoxin
MNKIFGLISLCLIASFSFSQTKGLEVGNKAPEIKLPNPAGDTITLSSLRGRVVLIDFWASWCEPCIEEQPELLTIYNKYRNVSFTEGNGFEIYGVSLDSKKTSWLKQIVKQKIIWTQVSDLKYWSSPIAKAYNLLELPFNMLIDGDGIIIAKNLHGFELDKALNLIKH